MSDFSTVQNLPDVNFVNTSVNDLLSAAITAYQNKYLEVKGESVTVQPGDDVYILLYAEALRQYSILQTVNATARMNLLKYSSSTYLDHLAANTGNVRSAATEAVTSVAFTMANAQATPVTIPAGTRVTAGDGIYFATDTAATIPIGSTSATVEATCTTTGTTGNGYIVGQLSVLVDSVLYITAVANTQITTGGSDKESDISLAEKIFASPSGYSVAGPASAYDYFVRAFSSAVLDTAVASPSAGVVDVYVLLTGGTLPNSTLLAEIATELEKYRPLTDQVSVLAPATVSYDVTLTYYIDSAHSADSSSIQSAVTQAVNDFSLWTKSKIGRDIIPDQLVSRIIAAGAKRVVLTSPAAYTAANDTSVAIAANVTLTFGGLE
jgi:phage-related baseplate assembly protein